MPIRNPRWPPPQDIDWHWTLWEHVQMPSSQKLQIWLKPNCTWMFIGSSSTKYRNIFFSEAIALIEPKLCINHWKVLYKLCVFYVDRNSKMTTTAGHSFYIGPIGSFYNQVNDTGSWEPLLYILPKKLIKFWNNTIFSWGFIWF